MCVVCAVHFHQQEQRRACSSWRIDFSNIIESVCGVDEEEGGEWVVFFTHRPDVHFIHVFLNATPGLKNWLRSCEHTLAQHLQQRHDQARDTAHAAATISPDAQRAFRTTTEKPKTKVYALWPRHYNESGRVDAQAQQFVGIAVQHTKSRKSGIVVCPRTTATHIQLAH